MYQPDDDVMVRRRTETQWVHKIHEVLIRMVGEQGELIAPGASVPAAERFSLMGRIDRWVVMRRFDVLESAPGPPDGVLVI